MFIKLSTEQYYLAQDLFIPFDDVAAVLSMFAGLTSGSLYVDALDEPQTAVLSCNRRVYLTGAVDVPVVNQFIERALIPEIKKNGLGSFLLHVSPEWEAVLPQLQPALMPILRGRLIYQQDARRQSWMPQLPDGFALRKVDASLLVDASITNIDFVTDEMLSERTSIADFLEKSFGYCAVRGNEVIGWCMSEYNVDNRCELGIATVPAYRKQGIATQLATAVIRHALSQNIHDIIWLCWDDNQGSVATAERLGFRRVKETAVWEFIFDTEIALAVHGNIQLKREEYAAAIEWFQQSQKQFVEKKIDIPDWVHWNIACAYTYLNQPESAFFYLHKEVDAGLDDVDFVINSHHLKPLHKLSAWQKFLNYLQKSGEKEN